MNSKKNIKGHLDLFCGVGGFSLALERAGIKPSWMGYSDIDNFANQVMKRRFKNGEQLGSITNVSYASLGGQEIDLLTGGFPCQSFSCAGERRGFEDTRGTLFFDVARICKEYIEKGRPIPFILLENVKGLLTHNEGRTFATIYGVLTNLNYTIECQLVNTRWILPQNRERIFIFGRYTGTPKQSRSKVFPITEDDFRNIKIEFPREATLRHEESSKDSKSGGRYSLHQSKKVESRIGNTQAFERIKESETSYALQAGEVQRIKVHSTQPRNPNRPSLTRICDCGSEKLYQHCCGVPGGAGPLSKEDGTTYCLDATNSQAVQINENETLRKLTPIECCRLQGYPDDWNDDVSDTQRYKQMGNSITVPIVEAIYRKMYEIR